MPISIARFSHIYDKVNWKNALLISFLTFLLIFPNIFYLVHEGSNLSLIIKYVGISVLFLLNPIVFFYRNIKVYLYFLIIFALLVPLVCFSIYLFDMKFGTRMAGLIFQSNVEEGAELTKGYRFIFILITILFTGIYIYGVTRVTVKRIPFLSAFLISIISIILVWGKMLQLKKNFEVLSLYGILDEYYPMSVISGTTHVLMASPNNLDKAKDFSFHAVETDSSNERQVYIFIIGESSRYDHWEVNGYNRPTSPRLAGQNNLITFSNVTAGAHFTWLSVPQMITRASPDNMDIQYCEKSILAAFDEVGFKTVWLSNQDPDYYTGSFTLHANTADICWFPGAQQIPPGTYDGRFLPVIDSIVGSDSRNLFLVFHTMGSHWDYSSRYPRSFDFFKPSGKTVSITPPKKDVKDAIINSYDNSIRYSDFIIDSVIQIVKKYNLVSYVTYVADHGEDLFDKDSERLNFHLTASRNTLHVPLFIWTSKDYNESYPEKQTALKKNQRRKIGENDVFYTLLNLADISYPGFDSTKSIASPSFKDSQQEYIEQGDKQVKYFRKLPN